MKNRIAKFDDYPLPQDPDGPFDATVTLFNHPTEHSGPALMTVRAQWRRWPSLRNCVSYIIHPKD